MDLFHCPNCGKLIPFADKCSYCGIDYSNVSKLEKWKKKQLICDIVLICLFFCVYIILDIIEGDPEEFEGPFWIGFAKIGSIVLFFATGFFMNKKLNKIKPDVTKKDSSVRIYH